MPTRCHCHLPGPSAPSKLSIHWVRAWEVCISINMCLGPNAAAVAPTVRRQNDAKKGTITMLCMRRVRTSKTERAHAEFSPRWKCPLKSSASIRETWWPN
jgi:hypothetical protein